MEELPKLYNDNKLDFNKSMKPDAKLTALREGLKNYYETFSITSNGFYEYLHKTNSKIILTEIKGHSFLTKYFSSIIFIHLTFEHFLIEILESKSQLLSKLSRNNFDLIKILININTIDLTNKQNIDFSEALNRVVKLINNQNELPNEYKLVSKYDFIKKHYKTLKTLSLLRNNIIHEGKTMLNRYIYELFFVNNLLPLIRDFLNSQEQKDIKPFIERNLYCKKNVINEIIKEPLPEEYDNMANYENTKRLLNRINHFKELGRASYNNPLHMFENFTNYDQKENIEQTYNKRIREDAELYVKFKQQTMGHYKDYTCPNCGTKSLTSYDFWRNLNSNKTRVETAGCSVCNYKINYYIGEPKDFGIMNDNIFEIIKE